MILYRKPYMMFDKEDGSGGNDDTKITNQTPEDIKKEMSVLFDDLGERTSTPTVKKPDDIDLDLDMQNVDEEGKEEEKKVVEEKKDEEGEETPGTVKDEKKDEEKETEQIVDDKDKKPTEAEDELEGIRADLKMFAETQLINAGISPDSALTRDEVVEKKKEEPVIAAKPEPDLPKPVEFKPIELTDELFEKIRENKDEFVTFLNDREKVLTSAIKEQVLLESLPTNKKFIESYVSSMNSVNQFYIRNPELDSFRPVVGFISAKLTQENPDWNREKVFQETEKGAYKLLRLTKGKQPPDNGALSGKAPGFARGTGARRGKPGEKIYKNAMQKELSEMAPSR